jgi:hypothetical protein
VNDLKYTGQETEDSPFGLYQQTLSPTSPNSLAFVGNVQTIGNLPVAAELQSRYLSLLWTGQIPPPSSQEMEKEIKSHTAKLAKTKYHPEDVSQVNVVEFLDWFAKEVGCDVHSRLTWGLWWRDRKLYNWIKKGVLSGHQFRYALTLREGYNGY